MDVVEDDVDHVRDAVSEVAGRRRSGLRRTCVRWFGRCSDCGDGHRDGDQEPEQQQAASVDTLHKFSPPLRDDAGTVIPSTPSWESLWRQAGYGLVNPMRSYMSARVGAEEARAFSAPVASNLCSSAGSARSSLYRAWIGASNSTTASPTSALKSP